MQTGEYLFKYVFLVNLSNEHAVRTYLVNVTN